MKTLNRFIFLFLFSFIAIGLFSDLTVSAQNTTSKPSTVISEEDSRLLQMSDKRFVKSNTAVHYVEVDKKKEDGAIRMVEKCYRKRH